MHESAYIAGNGNGNKLNRRIEMIEDLLKTADSDGTSARTNSLRQALGRNKSDMADDTVKSLDVLRQVRPKHFDQLLNILFRYSKTTSMMRSKYVYSFLNWNQTLYYLRQCQWRSQEGRGGGGPKK